MENNIINKASYFIQYLFIHKVLFIFNGTEKVDIKHGVFEYADILTILEDDYLKLKLELTSLSLITDEDAIHCANIMRLGLAWGYDAKIDWIKNWLTTKANITGVVGQETFRISIEIYQYLISKGYALPWMGLSVEKLIEYGWIKLID